ncbi:hypothetical protein [Blastococcus sp. VKM Ac-2987]|uniref:hypothetical protein n=1 Tax=Blastococcus sp. VKM Ac-2987 TaxID=3004141 RepID=UPI0022ABA094|nr:hypothetical protein [Blastococcus sp. VKM Ac-2987]MCZ2859063.1 hypothetical protein [Blastococcus sp. VKM Ac-2987]
MHRRTRALAALLLFVVLTGVAIGVSGARPALEQGAAPLLLQGLGYLCAITGGVLLLLGDVGRDRQLGLVVLAGTAVMAVVDALTAADVGANIGAGLVRLICLAVVGVVTARLAVALVADRRAGS